MRKLDLPVDQIIKEYQDGVSIIELAEEYKCSLKTIYNRLNQSGINVTNIIELPINQIIEEYQNGMNTIQLGEKYNCHNDMIIRRLKQNGVQIRTTGESKTLILPINEIIKEYKNNISINELSKKYNCSYNVIYKRLKQAGINFRHIINLPINKIIEDYQKGITIIELSEKYNCSCNIISDRLHKNNIITSLNLPIKQIIKEYQDGMNTVQLAEKYRCCDMTITKNLKKHNINIRTRKDAKNVLSLRFCINCGNEFMGKTTSIYCDECSPNKYCYKYNENCKEHNREKYNRECFFCGKSEEEIGQKHDTHHIDYDKQQGCNKKPDWKLVPLCRVCHSMTGGKQENRDLWEARILYLHKEYWSNINENK